MPVVFRYKGFRFFFFSNEGNPLEPLHVHVRKADAVAKIRLQPYPEIASSYGLSAHELRELLNVAIQNERRIERYWNDYFNG